MGERVLLFFAESKFRHMKSYFTTFFYRKPKLYILTTNYLKYSGYCGHIYPWRWDKYAAPKHCTTNFKTEDPFLVNVKVTAFKSRVLVGLAWSENKYWFLKQHRYFGLCKWRTVRLAWGTNWNCYWYLDYYTLQRINLLAPELFF